MEEAVDVEINPNLTDPSAIYHSQFDFTDSDVSITFTQKGTTVLCSVYGPAELPSSKRLNDKMAIQVVYTLENGSLDNCGEISELITAMIDRSRFLRLATAINGASLALLDSAVPLDLLLLAVSVALNQDGSITINPTKEEENNAVATAVIAFRNFMDDVCPAGFKSSGPIGPECYSAIVEVTKQTALDLLQYFRRIMEGRLSEKQAD
ncbi:hypothetical protein FO519_009062 [Halicephalobus sp. NKZ332]|nr:hypothetical protein FO519_009062 [Halicephalobus sp. NKZ332]